MAEIAPITSIDLYDIALELNEDVDASSVHIIPANDLKTRPFIPEISIFTNEAFLHLSENYRDKLQSSYHQKYKAVEGYVNGKILPDVYHLPELESFVDELTVLAPTYEAMDEKGWEPEIIFVPRWMGYSTWDKLLTSNTLPDGSDIKAFKPIMLGPYVDPIHGLKSTVEGKRWEVAIISSTDKPNLNNISKNGENGNNISGNLKQLFEGIPTLPDSLSVKELIAYSSPSKLVYQAFQLTQLEKGLMPVDGNSRSIGREELRTSLMTGSVYLFFDIKNNSINFVCDNSGISNDFVGIRPTAYSKDFGLNNKLKENTETN